MGEKDDTTKAAADRGGKKEDGPITAVLKLDLHCEGCAKKVSRSVRHFEGVENVKADSGNNELTVIGKVDPIWLRDRVAYKTKKKVELISPQPKMDGCGGGDCGGGGDEKSDQKSQKKLQGKNGDDRKSKEPTDSTVVMKIKLHCDGCAHKIKRTIVKNIDGVNSIKTDLEKDLITVNGKMNVKELTTCLKEKLKRSVEIVPSKKDDCHKDKKGQEGGGRDKKEKQGGDGYGAVGGGEKSKSDDKKMEINKMEFQEYNPQKYYTFPMYNQGYANQDNGVTMYDQSYTNAGDVVQYTYRPLPALPPPTYINVNDQMFSDENPNACFVM
ncbi:Heavy metal transport/detoxification superfamily protein [Abeliophyllum distichum]|uniref:Heavy metal transport/detoxification superfamily protein n=1 Tax=Abeliophyllum distichum TaxID=126358 RepID=A0ABD1RG12_9LAMI